MDRTYKSIAIEPWMCWAGKGDAALKRATDEGRGALQSMCW